MKLKLLGVRGVVGLGVWFRVISGVWSSIRSVTRGVCGQGKWSQGGGGSCMV